MNIVKTKHDLNILLAKQRILSKKIGLVPTMGSLHKGHISLIEIANKKSDFVWVTIFINPTQFNDINDFNSYPKEIDNDIKKIKSISEKINVFIPSTNEMFPENILIEKFHIVGINNILEGKSRPGHFNGVATIVKKLFNLFSPNMVFFGEKDFQQTLIVKELIKQFFPKITIFICPTIRNKDGLALSSRNQLISKKLLPKCKIIFNTLEFAKANYNKIDYQILSKKIKEKVEISNKFKLEYFEIRDNEKLNLFTNEKSQKYYRGFICVKVEGIRLIDNLLF